MSQNRFGVDTAFPPPPPPPVPGWPPQQPPPPGPPPARPAAHSRRRWPLLVAVGATAAAITSVAAAAITLNTRSSGSSESHTAPVTVTVAAPTTPAPAPLPTTQADLQTCKQGFLATDAPSRSAKEALATLPPGVKILDPIVQQDPKLSDAVRSAGEYYIQASQALATNIAPGTTPVLFDAANTMAKSLRVLGDSYTTFNPIAGNAHAITNEANSQMIALCSRLAP